jgi:hypothetical protein
MEPSAEAKSPAQPSARPIAPRPRPRPSSPPQGNTGRSAFELAKIIVGGIAGLAIAVLILNYFVGIDPLGWSVSSRQEDAKPKKVAEARPRVVMQPTVPSNPSFSSQPRNPVFPGGVGQVGPGNSIPRDRNPLPRNGFNPPPVKRPPSASPEETLPTEERSLADLANPGNQDPSVTVKKSTIPSAADQASKLTEIKEIYKTEFAAAKPGANPELVSFLRTTAAKVEGDPTARYVLYREAFKQACAGNDFDAAAETLDKLEAEFESEPFAPRFELLTRLASVAKANDERLIVANGSLLLLEHALALGKFEEGDKLARIADTQTKIIIDKDLRAKALAAVQTTSELAKDQKSVADAQEKLAESPNDPAANRTFGRYRCLIEGNWSEGLAHLAKCDDDAIKRAAALDVAGPSGDVTAGKIGDAWYDLAKAGKGQNFYARADYWYQKRIEVESGLAQVRLKKRHEEIAALKLPPRVLGQSQEQLRWPAAQALVSGGGGAGAESPSTDMFPLINLGRASPMQGWNKTEGSLTSPTAAQNIVAFVETSFSPPKREYTMQAHVTRSVDTDTKGKLAGGVMFGLTQKGKRFVLVIDDFDTNANSRRRVAYLTMGGTLLTQNPSVVRYSENKVRSDDVVCHVASDRITVLINGARLLEYTGDMSALAIPPGSKFTPAKPFFYAQEGGINILERWSVSPLSKNKP